MVVVALHPHAWMLISLPHCSFTLACSASVVHTLLPVNAGVLSFRYFLGKNLWHCFTLSGRQSTTGARQ
jgi:hypothetical protein